MSGEKVTVFCVNCKMPIGNMDTSDIGIDCYEICNLCYSKFYKLIEFVESLTMRDTSETEWEFRNKNEFKIAMYARKILEEINL